MYNSLYLWIYELKNKMKNTFYTTTPIYYTNWIPHIWHSYSSLICDILSRYNKTLWKKVKFATWVDENSQKAIEKANEAWMEIMDYLDDMAKQHKSVWDGLDIWYTDFVRTTQKRHHNLVREVLQKSFDNWDIYKWVYEWMYCVWCEAFKKEDDLIEVKWEKVCPDHLKKPEIIKEQNWFFKLSKYENFLKDFYKNNPGFVIPENRFNEVKAFVDRWLDDFSISRQSNTFGIKLPFDETQVTYVWFDALFNYITVCKYPDNWWDDTIFWPCDLHVVAKDIIRFHAIYWPAMLKSAWYEMPKQILTTWYFTVDWQKISKSLWNAIDPVEFCDKYSKDLLTLYMMSSINIGQDGDFSTKDAVLQYNAKLSNNLWNLVNRVVVVSLKLNKKPWILQSNKDFETKYIELILKWRENFSKSKLLFKEYNLKLILDNWFKYLDELNIFMTQTEPWQMIKDESKQEEVREILFTIAEWLRQVWLVLYPFFPQKMIKMFEKLWLKDYQNILENWWLEELQSKIETFEIKEKWDNLFERFDLE